MPSKQGKGNDNSIMIQTSCFVKISEEKANGKENSTRERKKKKKKR
jgi:hypothetical protein